MRWFTVLGSFGLIGVGLLLMDQESPTPTPSQVAPVISPAVVDQQQVEPMYPSSPQLLRPVYPYRSTPPVYPEHDASRYSSRDRDRH